MRWCEVIVRKVVFPSVFDSLKHIVLRIQIIADFNVALWAEEVQLIDFLEI